MLSGEPFNFQKENELSGQEKSFNSVQNRILIGNFFCLFLNNSTFGRFLVGS